MSEEMKLAEDKALSEEELKEVSGGGSSSMEFLDIPCPGCGRKPILKVVVSGAHFIAEKYIFQRCHWEAEKLPQ